MDGWMLPADRLVMVTLVFSSNKTCSIRWLLVPPDLLLVSCDDRSLRGTTLWCYRRCNRDGQNCSMYGFHKLVLIQTQVEAVRSVLSARLLLWPPPASDHFLSNTELRSSLLQYSDNITITAVSPDAPLSLLVSLRWGNSQYGIKTH